MTNAERKRLLRALMNAAKQDGWKGGSDLKLARKFLSWFESDGPAGGYADQDGNPIDVKALVAEQPDSRTIIVTEVDDEEPTDDASFGEEDLEEDEPKSVRRSGQGLANEVKRLRAMVESLKHEAKARPAYSGVKVKSAEEVEFDISVKRGTNVFSTYEIAKGFALQLQTIGRMRTGDHIGAQKSREQLLGFMDKAGMETKAYATTPLSSGGAFVFDEFVPDLIHLVDEYGVARSLSTIVRMNGPTAKRPRKFGFMDIVYPDEGGPALEQSLSSDLVTLTAKKGIGYSLMSSEILEDALIDVASEVARDIARGVAYVEDNTWVNGDGTSGTAGDRLIPNTIGVLTTFGTTAVSSSRSTIGGTTAADHELEDLYSLVALAPSYVLKSDPIFICSPQIDAIVFQRLAGSVGGMTVTEFEGKVVRSFLGYPIVHMETMPTTVNAPTDRVDILFGKPERAVMMGLRKELELVTSSEAAFPTDQIAIRGRVRHDINWHDLGSTTTSSPVVALFQKKP